MAMMTWPHDDQTTAASRIRPAGRGLHSFPFQLNLSRF